MRLSFEMNRNLVSFSKIINEIIIIVLIIKFLFNECFFNT